MVYTVTRRNEPVPVVSSVCWEVSLALAVSLPFFTLGIETSLGEPFDHAFILNNLAMRWYQTALLVVAAATAPVFAFVSQKFGRKAGYFCICLVQGLVFIPVFVSTHESLPYTYILIGISSGGIFTVLLPYIREITSIRTRGFCLTMTATMMMAGYQLRVLIPAYYDTIAFLVLGLVALQLIMMMVIVESPSYLVMVGKTERAKESISTIRRLPEDSPLILKEINMLNDEVARGTNGRITLFSLYRNKICWDSIKMCFLLFTTMELCGSLVFLDTKSACQCGIGLRDSNVTVAFVLLGSIITVIAVTFCDRKYILTFGYGTMAIALGVHAVIEQIPIQDASPVGAVLMVVMSLALPILLAAYGMASCLPAVVTVELFNTKVCTPILAALFTYSQLLRLLHAHTFFYLDKYIGKHAMFYIFAGVNLYGGVYTLFVVPNIRNKSLKQIEKQVLLVTGASAGIGEAIAILFAKCGAKLSLVGRNAENLRNVAARCEAERGVKPLTVLADLATDTGCEATAKETLDHFGRLDVLVNNAGIAARTCIERTDMATFDAVFNLNLRGYYNLTRLLVPALIASEGNIVNISSITATVVAVGNLPYAMAKAALDHFTQLISLELPPKGVRVNAVSPGFTESTILRRLLGYSAEQYSSWLVAMARRVPLGAVCDGEDVARAVLFLASDASRLLTGAILPVDGGLRFGNIANFAADQMS